MIRSFLICNLCNRYSNCLREDEIGVICNMNKADEKCTQNVEKLERKRLLYRPAVDG
jgi:hypothetical protein